MASVILREIKFIQICWSLGPRARVPQCRDAGEGVSRSIWCLSYNHNQSFQQTLLPPETRYRVVGGLDVISGHDHHGFKHLDRLPRTFDFHDELRQHCLLCTSREFSRSFGEGTAAAARRPHDRGTSSLVTGSLHGHNANFLQFQTPS